MQKMFHDKVAIVTGGGSGIGRAAALLFAREGAKVSVFSKSSAGGRETVEAIAKAGGEAIFIQGDVSDREHVQSMIDRTVAEFGRLDFAFNNAGLLHPKDSEWDEDAFRRNLEVHVTGVFLCMKYQIPHMLKQGKGAIVNTSSTHGLVGSGEPGMPGYVASKHAVIGLSRVAGLQYGKLGVRVNVICPGSARSAILDQYLSTGADAERIISERSILGRIADADEIAETAVWLCSDKASFVNAHALAVDGGFVAQ
jgi:NAD(P)-dependent dehydrogenase (short-subunit alcohol dehydrogenase family)